jgi:uncharacterized protein
MVVDKSVENSADGQPANRKDVLLLQFSREPRVGQVKTRMMPHLSAEQACELHCELTVWTCRQLVDSGLGVVELAVAGDKQHALFGHCRDIGANRILRQKGADLGARMYNAMRCALTRYPNVLLVGSDCPAIDASYLQRALEALRRVPVVLGPANDGGYVLIGAREIKPEFFHGIPWGSGQVYERSVAALRRAGFRWEALPPLTDIDRPEDLSDWVALKSEHKSDAASG